MKKYCYLCLLFLLLSACQQQAVREDLPVIRFTSFDGQAEAIHLEDEIARVEYIPLETTDESIMGNIGDLTLTDEYIFLFAYKVDGVLQFDRQGKFLRRFAFTGNGPGETSAIMSFSVDEENRLLYISQYFETLIYSFDGTFIKTIEISRPSSYQYALGGNVVAEVGRHFVPLTAPGMFGLGVFNLATQDTIAMKNDFYDTSLLPLEETGFKNIRWNYGTDGGWLAYVEGKDTLFRLTQSGISPAYVLETGYTESVRADMLKASSGAQLYDNMHSVFDFFETNNYCVIRTLYNDRFRIFCLDKHTGQLSYEQVLQDPQEYFGYNRLITVCGLTNKVDGGLPIWPYRSYPDKKILVQFNMGGEIANLLAQNKSIQAIPAWKEMTAESNPLITIYHLK